MSKALSAMQPGKTSGAPLLRKRSPARLRPRWTRSANQSHLDAALHDPLHRLPEIINAGGVGPGDDFVALDAGCGGRRGIPFLLNAEEEDRCRGLLAAG